MLKHKIHDFCTGDESGVFCRGRVVGDGEVAVGDWWGALVARVTSWGPFLAIQEGAVSFFSVSANVFVSEFELNHVGVCRTSLLVSDFQESFVEFLFD